MAETIKIVLTSESIHKPERNRKARTICGIIENNSYDNAQIVGETEYTTEITVYLADPMN